MFRPINLDFFEFPDVYMKFISFISRLTFDILPNFRIECFTDEFPASTILIVLAVAPQYLSAAACLPACASSESSARDCATNPAAQPC